VNKALEFDTVLNWQARSAMWWVHV